VCELDLEIKQALSIKVPNSLIRANHTLFPVKKSRLIRLILEENRGRPLDDLPAGKPGLLKRSSAK
jgi:hypothetical protein